MPPAMTSKGWRRCSASSAIPPSRISSSAGWSGSDGELFVAADDEPAGLAALQIMHVLQRDAPSARLTALVVREDARAAYRALGFEDTGRRYAKRL